MQPNEPRRREKFSFLCENVAGWLDTSIVIAASRCGATGILNCEGIADLGLLREAVKRIRHYANGGAFGVKLEADSPLSAELLAGMTGLDCVVLSAIEGEIADLAKIVALARSSAQRVLLEVTSVEQATRAAALPIDGFIAKGQEAGGAVGEETTFILLQRLLHDFSAPVWAHGGVGCHSVAACYVAGAAGAVLDSQLLLLAESSLPPRVRAAVERSEGDETLTLGRELGRLYRVYRRPGMTAVDGLQQLERELVSKPLAEARVAWREALHERVNWRNPDAFLWPLGQDSAFAAPLAARFATVSGLVEGLRDSITQHVAASQQFSPLAPGSALAKSNGTEYPVLQGPMTRVSDTAGFAAEVAKGGGLPFLALALLRGPQVRKLLEETKHAAGDRPWGVGILGFVPSDLRAEQLEVTHEFRPPFAIIAGGRPDQAAKLEQEGTVCYLHVPAPALLDLFIRDGARRFIFEGRECGGHIGPRTSFVLWESMIDVLLRAIDAGIPGEQFHAVFAGGIHDARSAAMLAAMAAPLAARGVRIGALMGTAYLFTREAVETGAIVELFQEEALQCSRTVVLETGPGHATRCADTPFYDAFLQVKRALIEEHQPHEKVREELEQLNLGRLRVASKGITRVQEPSAPARHVEVSREEQRREGMYMIGQVASMRDRVCTVRDLHEEVSGGGERYLQSVAVPQEKQADDLGKEAPCDIAIVGMSCVLPKAPDVKTFWANLLNKVDAITEIPPERFNIDLYYDADRKARDKIYTRWGGFIDDVPFEPLRYGIPPTALGSIDPMQLLSLIMVDRALDDAGYRTREFPRQKTSVIFGTSGGLGDLGGHYAIRSSLPEFVSDVPEGVLEQLPEWTEDSFAGLLPNVAAGRVANRFNLGGVNFTVDAACASSLAAMYVGTRELTTHSSDMVIIGGVDTVQSPFCFLCFSKAQALSPRGRCRPFDESADGIAISEGITVLVMKRLADAERDGDRIYSVIKAVSGSSDGRGRSMTAPRQEGQKLVLRRAYRQAGFSPATVGLMEAHGTGTVAGDTTEMASLSDVLVEAGAAEHSCAVGSIKSLVGHTKAAAGVTGVMKVALSLYHKVLPPTLHVEKPNTKLRESGSPLFVSGETLPWLPPVNGSRRAGVSSFGFGGTNFHAVLEEYLGEFRSPADRASAYWPAELFVWSAPTAAVLSASLAGLADKLQRGAGPELHELAAAVCRRAGLVRSGPVRLAVVASSLEDLRTKLDTARAALDSGRGSLEPSSGYLALNAAQPGRIAFLFPGQGSQEPGMLRDLSVYFPEFRASLETADGVLAGSFPKRLSSYIYPPPAFTPEEKKAQMAAITDTLVAQPSLGVVEIALAHLLKRLGVEPAMTAGHSYGEYVALCAAGVFSEETLFALSEARGRAIKEATGTEAGAMIAASGPADRVVAALNGLSGITVANYNSPKQTVLAGTAEKASTALELLKSAGINAVKIPVACAFHSPLVQPARDQLSTALAGQSFAKPSVAVFSNTLGERYPDQPAEIASVLTDHLVRPVRFMDEVRAMYAEGGRIFIETGPKGVLTGLVRQILDGTDARTVQVDVSGRHGIVSLLQALGQLIVLGVPVDTGELFRGRSVARLDIEALEPVVLKPSQWLVNGGRSHEVSRPPVAVTPVPVVRTVEVEKLVERVVERQVERTVEVARTAEAPVPAYAPSGIDALMGPFQQLMGQFLQTQAAVMMAYLQGAPAGSPEASVTPMPVMMPATVPVPAVPMPAPQRAIQASPAPNPIPAQPLPVSVVAAPAPLTAPKVAPRRDVLAELVRIASERTGYPAEMLDPNAAIEADLGIDSIKRVEILSSFQQLCNAEEQACVQKVMEKLTSAPSLRTIADLIVGALGRAEPVVAQPAPAATASNSAPPARRRDVLAELVRIASERTGYPAEMLDPNAAIEADLGIDSIKRVEILSSFQQLCNAEEQACVQKVMEKLTSAPSLRAIADLIVGTLGGAEPVVAQPAPTAAAPTTLSSPARRRDVLAELVRIASERTGYPAEMLDPNAAIEADLGIDSIKRVEILSSFQQLCDAEEQACVQKVMEKLTSAPSLRTIADLIVGALGRAEPVVAQPAPAATASPGAPPARRRDVLVELVRIASERTGYPAEMLDPNAAIEADLGIDSIKRVEILSSFQQLCNAEEQACVQKVMEKLTSAPSLRAIADLIINSLSGPPNGTPDGSSGNTAGGPKKTKGTAPPPIDIARFTFGVVDRPRQGSRKYHPGRVCLLTDDETGISAGIADAWKAAGEKVVLLRHCAEAPLHANGVVSGNLADPSVVNALVQMVRAQHGAIGAIVHLLPLRAEAAATRNSLAEWRDHLQQDLKSLYLLVRACETDLNRTDGALIAVATGRGGSFALGTGTSAPATHQAIADFSKTVAVELPGVLCKVVDVDLSDPVTILREKLLDELSSTDSTFQVGLPGDRRVTPVLRHAPLNGSPKRDLGADAVFLLTGGARGITAELARLAAERYHPTLILTGTTPLPVAGEGPETAGIADRAHLKTVIGNRLRASGAKVRPADIEAAVQGLLKEREISATLDALRRSGAKVEYFAVDVRDEAAFGGLLDRIYAQHGRLDVVVHGAGIIEDKLIRDKVPESFDRVVHTKADSTYILANKLRADSLKCLLLMSSVTAAFGNRGQGDYGAANGVMNGYALGLARTWPGRVVSVNWGPWDQANMVSEPVRKQFLARGLQLIPLAAGAEAAMREIELAGNHEPVVVLGGGPWHEYALSAEPFHHDASLRSVE